MDLQGHLDRAFTTHPGADAPHPPVSTRIAAGRQARRRRTASRAAGSVVLLLAIGSIGSAVATSRTTDADRSPAAPSRIDTGQPSPTAATTAPSEESTVPAGALPVVEGRVRTGIPDLVNGRLVLPMGTRVLERIDRLGLDGHPEAVGLRLRIPGEAGERWVMAHRGGWTEREQWMPGRRYIELQPWLEDTVSVAEGRDTLARQFDVTAAGLLIPSVADAEVLEQLGDPDLGPGMGARRLTQILARVRIAGVEWFVAGSVQQPHDPQLVRYQPAAVGVDASLDQVADYIRTAFEEEAALEDGMRTDS